MHTVIYHVCSQFRCLDNQQVIKKNTLIVMLSCESGFVMVLGFSSVTVSLIYLLWFVLGNNSHSVQYLSTVSAAYKILYFAGQVPMLLFEFCSEYAAFS